MNGPRVRVARTAGFCFGVDRAVRLVREEALRGGAVYTLGEIIHNPQIVQELSEVGVRVAQRPQEVPHGATCIIRSHGVGPQVLRQLHEHGARVVDATCPFVAKIHRIVSAQPPEGLVLLAGDPHHPEVEGIVAHASCPVEVFQSARELEQLCTNCKFFRKNSQNTGRADNFQQG